MTHYSLPISALVGAALALTVTNTTTRSTHTRALLAPCSHPATTENVSAQLAKFRPVRMPFSTAGLSSREIRMVRKLVEAGQYLESIYWRQSDPEGLALYKALARCSAKAEKDIRHYLLINGSSFDLLEGNKPFLANATYSPGRSLYPAGITRKEIEDYVAAHPEKRAEI